MKMLHVTIHTDRFEDELKFYQEIVGLKIVNDRRPARQMVFLANGEGETEIEIIGETEAKDAGNENLAVGFRSEDPEKKREELIALGYDQPRPRRKLLLYQRPCRRKGAVHVTADLFR